jgi:NAD(P)-dependent dehydrogenase (short-subunit alcohol dehydrogenase family)
VRGLDARVRETPPQQVPETVVEGAVGDRVTVVASRVRPFGGPPGPVGEFDGHPSAPVLREARLERVVDAQFVETDVSDGASVSEAIDATVETYEGLDVLVNNAGISHEGTVEETDPEEWHRVLEVNLTGVYNGVRHAVPHLKESPAPRVVNVASQLAFVAQPRKPAYVASKGGVVSLTRSLALDYADVPIQVNAVCPGVVETELTREALAADDRRAAFEARTPLPYLGEPDDVGAVATFLASDHARFVTGQSFVVDGGYTIQ